MLQGYKDSASMEEATSFPDFYKSTTMREGTDGPGPHLTASVKHGNGTGFLQIQPLAVSAALTEVLDDEHSWYQA